jgi:hypothetical protein
MTDHNADEEKLAPVNYTMPYLSIEKRNGVEIK